MRGVVKVVYKVNKGSFKVYYRQKGTTTELAEATVDNNDGQEYDVSFVNTFHAKDIAGYRPVKANLEATIQHKGVNEVVFEYEPVTDIWGGVFEQITKHTDNHFRVC